MDPVTEFPDWEVRVAVSDGPAHAAVVVPLVMSYWSTSWQVRVPVEQPVAEVLE